MRRSKVLVVRGIAALVLVALGLSMASPTAAQASPNCNVTFTGDVSAFTVTPGAGSVAIDPNDAGTGLQSLTVVAGPVNATVSHPFLHAGNHEFGNRVLHRERSEPECRLHAESR